MGFKNISKTSLRSLHPFRLRMAPIGHPQFLNSVLLLIAYSDTLYFRSSIVCSFLRISALVLMEFAIQNAEKGGLYTENIALCPTIFPTNLSPDWSARMALEASLQALDPDAIALARERYKQQAPSRAPEINALDDAAFLKELGLVREGGVTKAALLLLGKPQSTWYLDGSAAILWRLHFGDGDLRAYEFFPPPFLTAMDEALAKLRILPYRYMADPSTLFPEVAPEQDIRVLRELLANAIAHGDYCGKSGLVYLDEYEDKVSITSIGSFPRDRVQAVLRDSDGARIPRNPLLKGAMEKLGMLDPEVRCIRRVCEVLRARYFPLPEYNFTFSLQATVHVYGRCWTKPTPTSSSPTGTCLWRKSLSWTRCRSTAPGICPRIASPVCAKRNFSPADSRTSISPPRIESNPPGPTHHPERSASQ